MTQDAMNQTINEQLSALMDGELERDQTRFLLKRIEADHELPQRWTRYHLVRQTLRRQEMPTLSVDFTERVMATIEIEPTAHARVQPVWLRWGAGGAIAASVAVVALMLAKPPTSEPERSGLAARTPTSPASTQLAAAPAAPVSVAPRTQAGADFRPPLLAPATPIETAPANFGTDLTQPIATDPRMQSYLIRHYQTAGAAGQTAFVPYVLLVAPQRESVQAAGAQTPQNR